MLGIFSIAAQEADDGVPEPKLVTVDKSHFLVVGEKYQDVRFVAGIGEAMVDMASRYIGVPREFTPAVIVYLIGKTDEEFSTPYNIIQEHKGVFAVRIRWT